MRSSKWPKFYKIRKKSSRRNNKICQNKIFKKTDINMTFYKIS